MNISPTDGRFMPTINRKLLLRLFIVTLVLGVGVFFLHYVQSDRATEALRWQAERAAELGKPEKAILYMRQYLELRPDDHEAVIQLAELVLKRGAGQKELTTALFLFERVLRESPERQDVRLKLLDISLRLNRNSDAMIHARALLEKSPRDSELWDKLGRSQSGQNKYDDARQSFETAIDCDPHRILPYELLADLLNRQLNLKEQTREVLDKMVRTNPSNFEAYLVRANYYRSEEKTAECLRDVDKLLEIDPENADGLVIAAEIAQKKGDIAQARSVLTEGLAMHVKDVRFYRALAWLELSARNVAAATDCLEQGTRELPTSTELLTPLADLYAQQGDVAKVQEIINKLEGQPDVVSQIKYLRGRVLMEKGKWADAAGVFENLRTEAVAMPGLAAQSNLLLANCLEHLGNREAQVDALKRVLQIDAANLNARLRFGMLDLELGDIDEAIKEYQIAVRSAFAPLSARITLGRLLIARARSANISNAWNSVSEYVDALHKQYPNTVDPLLLTAEMHIARQQPEKARQLLRTEAGKKVHDVRIWSVLASIAQEERGLLAALDVLEEAQALIGDKVDLRLAQARCWATDWQPGREERIRKLAKNLDELPDADQLRLLTGLVDICSQINYVDGVKHFQKEIAARLPSELPIRRALFDVAMKTRDNSLANRVRDEMLQSQGPNGNVVAVADALAVVDGLDASDEKCAAFDQLAVQILSATPDRADAHLLKAKLAEKAGDRMGAAEHYGLAISFESTNLKFIVTQLNFLVRTANDVVLKRRIEQLYADPRLPGESFLSTIDEATVGVSPDRWNLVATWVGGLLQKSGESLLLMARLEQARGRTAQALALANQATTTAPKLLDAWAARVRLKPEISDETLKSARAILDNQGFFLVCAEVADDIHKTRPDWSPNFEKPEDRRAYTQAVASAYAIRGKIAEATGALNTLAQDKNARQEDVDWAKRTMTMLTATTGNTNDRRNAVATMNKWTVDPSANPDDLRTKVSSIAAASKHLSGAERKAAVRQAIEALKLIVESKNATAKDWYNLAQFQKLAEDRPAYLECLKEAMKRDADNLLYTIAYVDELLVDDKLSEAEPFIEKLTKMTQESRAAATVARYYVMTESASQALQVLEQYIQAADAGTQDSQVRVRQAAEMLDQLARFAVAQKARCARTMIDAAVDKYKLTMKSYPEAVGPLAAMLAFDNRMQAALDLLAQAKANISSKVLAPAGLGVLRNGNATPRQIQLVKSWFDAALRDSPKSVNVRMNLADLYAMLQDYPSAEQIYRDVLAIEPDNVVALNNLAWMLSPKSSSTDEALKCVNRAIELMGPNGELLDTRARIYIARGDYNRAIDELNQALAQSHTSLRYFHMALAQLKQLKNEEAQKSFKEAQAHGLDPRTIHVSDQPIYRVLSLQTSQ